MRVYARHALVGSELWAEEPALLLEGEWPSGESPLHCSLDEAIDARHAWIDAEASRVADALAQASRRPSNIQRPTSNVEFCEISAKRPSTLGVGRSMLDVEPTAYLNELKLRYYLVKLLRVVAFFAETQPDADALELFAARQRDEDYADLFTSLAAAHSWRMTVNWRDASATAPMPVGLPPNAWWRRAAASVSSRTNPSWPAAAAPRVVLCGSRRVLDGVCGELVRRGAAVTWLYERFAVRTWLRWRAWGVGQLLCASELAPSPLRGEGWGGGRTATGLPTTPDSLSLSVSARGIDLTPAVARWLATTDSQHGEHQRRVWCSVDEHFAHLRPTHLVLDEDATPTARAAVAAARRHGALSIVVQHGVPRVKFGFAPLAADYLFAWGEASRRQFLRWGVPPERVRVVGYPGSPTDRHVIRVARRPGTSRSFAPHILLVATMPPRDERPDVVTFHLTTGTHRRMLHMACAAVADWPGARLTIKLHPRCRDATIFRQVAADYPHLCCRILQGGDLRRLVRHASCVLSCTSSAGIEAAQLGATVIELVPAGSHNSLPANEWGLLGAAHNEAELRELLRVALERRSRPDACGRVFTAVGPTAAARVVDESVAIPPRRGDRDVEQHVSHSALT